MALFKVKKTAEVLFLKPSTDRDYPWVLVCYDPAMQDDRWVVQLADDDGDTVIAGYHSTLEEALAVFDSLARGAPAISY